MDSSDLLLQNSLWFVLKLRRIFQFIKFASAEPSAAFWFAAPGESNIGQTWKSCKEGQKTVTKSIHKSFSRLELKGTWKQMTTYFRTSQIIWKKNLKTVPFFCNVAMFNERLKETVSKTLSQNLFPVKLVLGLINSITHCLMKTQSVPCNHQRKLF